MKESGDNLPPPAMLSRPSVGAQATATPRMAMFLPSLYGGGAEKVMFSLAWAFSRRGLQIDLVLSKAQGPYLARLPSEVRVIDLAASRMLASLPGLIRYLRRERPTAMLSAMDHANVVALMARRLAGVPLRTIVSVHTHVSSNAAAAKTFRGRFASAWIRPFYPWADEIVAVSQGVADDLVFSLGLPRDRIKIIHNPVVTPELLEQASQPVDHPWFKNGQPPVVLSTGRLTDAKDFGTLLRAFATVRKYRPARLMILGEGALRGNLEMLAKSLGIESDFALPGFVDNPFPYMRASRLFVLSSQWEGFGNVLAEAMACGTPVISTDCRSGPAEILEGGRWGTLVPVGDVSALANAMLMNLDAPALIGMAHSVSVRFGADGIADRYLELIAPQPSGPALNSIGESRQVSEN